MRPNETGPEQRSRSLEFHCRRSGSWIALNGSGIRRPPAAPSPAATASGQLGKVRKPPCCPTCGLIEAVAPSVVEHHHERRL